MELLKTSLWPDLLGTQTQLEFWLDSPEIPAEKAEATRRKLAEPLQKGEVQKMWVRLFTHLCTVRAAGPHPATEQVTALCLELYSTGLVDRDEISTIKHRLMVGTQREFDWHQERLWEVLNARQRDKRHAA